MAKAGKTRLLNCQISKNWSITLPKQIPLSITWPKQLKLVNHMAEADKARQSHGQRRLNYYIAEVNKASLSHCQSI